MDSRCVVVRRRPLHRASYLYAKADTAQGSNARRALGTVDDTEESQAWVDEGECSVQCVRCSLKARLRSLRERRRRRASALASVPARPCRRHHAPLQNLLRPACWTVATRQRPSHCRLRAPAEVTAELLLTEVR